jgi:hypothetical protein
MLLKLDFEINKIEYKLTVKKEKKVIIEEVDYIKIDFIK